MEDTFNFGTRKIRKIGDCYMVTVPTQWMKNVHLGEGDKVNIEMDRDKDLKIRLI